MKRSLRLLLVEDSSADAELLLLELNRYGFDTLFVRVDSEPELRRALAAGSWEMVVCDHGLPNFSSGEALQIVHESAPDVPFVIMSGTIGEEAAVEALRAGVRDVVLKGNLARLGPVVDRELREAENRSRQRQLECERAARMDELEELNQRHAELNEKLRVSEMEYRLLFEHNPRPMLVSERETHQIVAANHALVTTYGYTHEQLLSMTTEHLHPGEGEDSKPEPAIPVTEPAAARARRTEGFTARPERHRYRDGTIVDVEVTSNDLRLRARDCQIELYHDVTERNRASADLAVARDQAVEASNMKSAFLANMSHEIRTPMNGVIGMNQLLLTTELSEEQRGYAEQAERSGEEALVIVGDILDISKLVAGRLGLERGEFLLREAVHQACAVAVVRARTKGIAFALHFTQDVPRHMSGDGRRLRQVLANLVSNAIKFTAAGSVVVSVTVSARDQPHDRRVIRVEIADTGIGVSPAVLDRMFDPFTQADVSLTRSYGGTGLGLAIARELVTLMGGTIGAQSEPGSGSTFWFELAWDAPATDGEPSHPRDAVGATPQAGPVSPLVLVAEDNLVNQIVAVRLVERCGYRTHVAVDGLAALRALSEQRYDAVLMDCQMPEMDGYQVTIELRRRERGCRRTPVIAMTAHVMTGDHEKCLEAGMDDYLSKPIRYQAILDTLRRWAPLQAKALPSPKVLPSL